VTYDMQEILGPRGLLAQAMEVYEYRPQQVEMAEAICKVLRNGDNLVVEAGPGTGKTFAYLVPALYSGTRVVVSTGTKNLQDQIFHKDVPFLKRVLPLRFKVAYMKGRENYLCQRRLKIFRRQPLFETLEEATLFKDIEQWARHTQTGDRDEVEKLPENLQIWREICCSRDHCLGTECPNYKRCFLTRMRQEAAEAHLIVVNHHLFFADLAIRDVGGEVIPRYSRVIFDEAHQIEEIVTSYFGLTVSNYRVEELTRDVRSELTEGTRISPKLHGVLDALAGKAADLFYLFQGEERYRLRELDPLVVSLLSDIKGELIVLRDHLSEQPWKEEIACLLRRSQELEGDLEFILSMGDPSYVYWCENRGRGVFLKASPVDVGPELKRSLYRRVKSLVFTSATLSTHGGFDYFKERLGLEETDELIVAAPFDFQRQVILYLPQEMPEPTSPAFPQAAAKQIEDILKITKGRAFVLCTSYKNMRDMYRIVEQSVPYHLLIQGERPKHLLLEVFKTDLHSVLFATGSFWEGVDVPGETLSCVIIDKLPFDPPTEPIVQARIERIASQGENPFYHYQVPAAIIALKQGLGRLIRSREDRGVLAILDSRLLTKAYGKIFLQSLPPTPVVHRLQEIRRIIN